SASGSISGSIRSSILLQHHTLVTNSRWHHAPAASMAVMPSKPQNLPPPASRNGFVVAMRAKILTARDSPWQEWIIVSRWGSGGEHLSISRTRVSAAPGVAPIQLAPRQTALAGLLRLPADGVPATFLLVQAVPGSISIAGDFT